MVIVIKTSDTLTILERFVLDYCNVKNPTINIENKQFELDPQFFQDAYSGDKITHGEHKVGILVHKQNRFKYNRPDNFVSFKNYVTVTKLEVTDYNAHIIKIAVDSDGDSNYIVKYYGCFNNEKRTFIYVIKDLILTVDKKFLVEKFKRVSLFDRLRKYSELLGIICELFVKGYTANINPYAWHYVRQKQKIDYVNLAKIGSQKLNPGNHIDECDYKFFVEPFGISDIPINMIDTVRFSESTYSIAMTILFFENILSENLEIEQFSVDLIDGWAELRPYNFKCGSEFTIECTRAVIDYVQYENVLSNFDVVIDGISPKEIIIDIIDVDDSEYFDKQRQINLLKSLKGKFDYMLKHIPKINSDTNNI